MSFQSSFPSAPPPSYTSYQQQQPYPPQQQPYPPQQQLYPPQQQSYQASAPQSSHQHETTYSENMRFSPEMRGDTQKRIACAIVGLVLAAVTALAAYYCFANGFNFLDMSYSNLHTFAGASLIYMGLTFACVSVANILYSGCKTVCHEGDNFDYSRREAKYQIAGSIFAPIAAIPLVLCCGIAAVAKR